MAASTKTSAENKKFAASGETYLRSTITKFKDHRMALFGFFLLVLEIVIVIFLPVIIDLDPYTSDVTAFGARAPGPGHILGTDVVGRDIFARLVYGGRTSLTIGILSSLIGLLAGLPPGLLAGFYRNRVETLVMRLTDIFMSFPSMVLILVLVAVTGTSIWTVTAVIGILGWTQYSRLIYSKVLSIREMEYVESARAVGTRDMGIILGYVLPNAMAPILIQFTFRTAQAIIMESALSFLGMGIQPPLSTWGNMMYDAQAISILAGKPWVWVPPGLCLMLTVLSINSVGDGIRDAMDPKTRV
jgi:peptide/nickel transport system permease protein